MLNMGRTCSERVATINDVLERVSSDSRAVAASSVCVICWAYKARRFFSSASTAHRTKSL